MMIIVYEFKKYNYKEKLNEKDLKIAKDILNDINMALKGK